MGESRIGCAPKGDGKSQLDLPIYKHFTATRLLRVSAGLRYKNSV